VPGRPKKPANLKSISGTAQPCRATPEGVKFDPLSEIPDPPDWLPNSHAVKEWNRCVPMLVSNRLLTEINLSMLGHLCALHGKLVQLWAAGESPTGHMLSQYNKFCGDFGLPPSSWAKVKSGGSQKPGNPFAEID